MSATRTSLPPSLAMSNQHRQRWKTFVEDDELSCYSFYLPHNDNDNEPSSTTDTNSDFDNGNENDGENSNSDDSENDTSPAFTTSQLNEWFRALHPSNYKDEPTGSAWTDATYKNELLLRKTAWHSFDEECSCQYGYSDTWQPLITSQRMKNALTEITRAVSNVMGLRLQDHGDGEEQLKLNSVNLNYYPQGGGVGFHADDEFLFDGLNRETRIVSLSLCSNSNDESAGAGAGDSDNGNNDNNNNNLNYGARKFQVKRKGKNHDTQKLHEIILRHGDLMTMEGMFQKYYLHSVWPGDSQKHTYHELCRGERINLTWRTIVRHLDGSEKESRGLTCPLSKNNHREG